MAACRGLLYCMEYLEESLDDWLGEELQVLKPITISLLLKPVLPLEEITVIAVIALALSPVI